MILRKVDNNKWVIDEIPFIVFDEKPPEWTLNSLGDKE